MLLIELPETEYSRVMVMQERLVQQKLQSGGPDVLFVLEHPPTITLGKRARHEDLKISPERLARMGLAVQLTDRGGEATYHGPGQIVCYPVMDLKRLRLRIRDFVHGLEETVIRTLACFGVQGFRQEKKIGVWTAPLDKIASIGVRVTRRVTSHGFSLNVNLRVDPADLIVVCGMPEVRMVSLSECLDRHPDVGQVKRVLFESFSDVFGVVLEPSLLPASAT